MGRYLTWAIAFAIWAACAAASPLGPDGSPGHRLPGKFIWFDLATEDPAAARAFYGAVFGWKFREAPGASVPYTLIENGSGKIGGMFAHARPAGAAVGARWLSLISVADPARAAAYVRAHGGEVVREPNVIAGRGTHAVFRDPEGAVFGVLANEGGDPADTPVEDSDFFWLDLFARDPARESGFYSGLAGYEVAEGEVAGRNRILLASEAVARAGIAHLPAGADKPGWLPYVLVGDVPAALERVRRAGGRIVMQPRTDLLGGNLAVIADPAGGLLGVVNWVPAGEGVAR